MALAFVRGTTGKRRPGFFKPEPINGGAIQAEFYTPFNLDVPELAVFERLDLKGTVLNVPSTWQEFGTPPIPYEMINYCSISTQGGMHHLRCLRAMVQHVSADSVSFEFKDNEPTKSICYQETFGNGKLIPHHRLLAILPDVPRDMDHVLFRGVVSWVYPSAVTFLDAAGIAQTRIMRAHISPGKIEKLGNVATLADLNVASIDALIDGIKPECKQGFPIDRDTIVTYVGLYMREK